MHAQCYFLGVCPAIIVGGVPRHADWLQASEFCNTCPALIAGSVYSANCRLFAWPCQLALGEQLWQRIPSTSYQEYVQH